MEVGSEYWTRVAEGIIINKKKSSCKRERGIERRERSPERERERQRERERERERQTDRQTDKQRK